jgi:hypothetical protein
VRVVRRSSGAGLSRMHRHHRALLALIRDHDIRAHDAPVKGLLVCGRSIRGPETGAFCVSNPRPRLAHRRRSSSDECATHLNHYDHPVCQRPAHQLGHTGASEAITAALDAFDFRRATAANATATASPRHSSTPPSPRSIVLAPVSQRTWNRSCRPPPGSSPHSARQVMERCRRVHRSSPVSSSDRRFFPARAAAALRVPGFPEITYCQAHHARPCR